MRAANVRVPLFLTILIMGAAPLIAAFWLLDDSLATSLNLGFNPQVVRALEQSSDNLRTLGRLDAARRDAYRTQFEEVQALKHVYSNPDLIKRGVQESLQVYFGIGFAAAVLLSVAAAGLLSRRIARSYRLAFEELSREREKVRYLQEMSSWQELARMLAHEIKNPLTPIEVLVSSLSRSYLQKGANEFREQLAQTERMINEELNHLKNTVNRFGEFARLPQVQPTEENLADVLAQHVKALAASFGDADLHLDAPPAGAPARIDSPLFRQVLTNIVRNGVEANPGRRVRFDIRMSAEADRIRVAIANDGEPVAPDIASRIFDPYVSTKSGKDNMGLGLAIVRKIIIEHGGDVAYECEHGRPSFVITLPRRA